MKHSIILIKSVSDDNTSSCCSGVEGGGTKAVFNDSFKTLYTHIKENHSENVDLDILDPRNSFLIFILIKDFLRFKVPILKSIKTLFTYSVPSVIINGTVVFNAIPSPEELEEFLGSDF